MSAPRPDGTPAPLAEPRAGQHHGLAALHALGHDAPVFVARHRQSECPLELRPVTHNYAVLAFYIGGSARMEQAGTWTMEAGDVLLVPAGQPHRLLAADQSELWGLGFCVPCLVAERSAPFLESFERVRAGESAVVRIPAPRRAFLESLFVQLSEEVARADAEALVVQQSLVTLILAEVHRAAAWKPQVDASSGLVADSLRFIEQHCLGPLSLKEVAAAVHRSPAHVTTALKRATGRSAVEWIIAGRLAEARRRLLHSDERVDIIAERVGYTDPTHFIRLFRRAHGLTPAAWRTKNRSTDA